MQRILTALLLTVSAAPAHAEQLDTILQDEACDDRTVRIVGGATLLGLGAGLTIGGFLLVDNQSGPQNLAAIIVISGGLGAVVGGIIALVTTTDLEDIAADYVAGRWRDDPVVRLEKLAKANRARRYRDGGVTAAVGLLSLLQPLLEPPETDALVPALITGGSIFAIGMYFLFTPSNAEQALDRYHASGTYSLETPRFVPTLLVTPEVIAVGVNGTF